MCYHLEMMMSLNRCKVLHLSDIHFGNGRVSPIRTYERLQDQLYPLMKEIDLLVIGGDLFDTLLNMNSDAGLYVAKFIDDIITLAIKHSVYIRVVRGTFSHDRHQNRFFLVKDRGSLMLNDTQLVRVIDRVVVEHIKDLDLTLLYCPDDQPHNDMNQTIIDVIKTNHLQKVDLLCSHGYYEHLLPVGIPHIPHNTLSYTKLEKYVDGIMLNGHIHKASVYMNKVISSGSFERFEFGNESPVGMWMVEYTKKHNKKIWTYKFLENKDTLVFKTFVSDKYNTPEELCFSIDEFMQTITRTDEPVYIRIMGNVEEGISEWIKSSYKNVIVTDKRVVTQETVVDDLQVDTEELPIITEDNLALMVYNNLAKDANLSLTEVEKIIDEL